MAEQKSARTLPRPLHAAASAVRKVPGAGTVGRAAEGALDRIGAVSPRGRRVLVYTGAGVLGVAGLVEWPVAVTGAAVAWLTQPRGQNGQNGRGGDGGAAKGGDAEAAGARGAVGSKPARTSARKTTSRAATAKAATAKTAAAKAATGRTAAAKTAGARASGTKAAGAGTATPDRKSVV